MSGVDSFFEKPEDEIYALKREMRIQEADFKKKSALLEQKVELLEMQLEEAQAREENLKRLQDTMLSAFGDSDSGGNRDEINKELDLAREHHQKDMDELKEAHQIELERMKAEIENTVNTYQREFNDLREREGTLDKRECKWKDEIQTLANEKSVLEEKIKTLESELTFVKDDIEKEIQRRLIEENSSVSHMKDQHEKEIAHLRDESDKAIVEIRQVYEQDKKALEDRLEGYSENMHHLQEALEAKANQEQANASFLSDLRDQQHEVEEIRAQAAEELNDMTRQRDDGLHKINLLENDLAKLKAAFKTIESTHKTKLEQAKQSIEASEGQQEDIKKLRKQSNTLRATIGKLEVSERKLKNMLVEKENQMEEERIDFKRKFVAERKKAQDAGDNVLRAKDGFEKKKNVILQEMIHKDDQIETLSKHVNELKNELSKIHTALPNDLSMTYGGQIDSHGNKRYLSTTSTGSVSDLRTGTDVGRSSAGFSTRSINNSFDASQKMLDSDMKLGRKTLSNLPTKRSQSTHPKMRANGRFRSPLPTRPRDELRQTQPRVHDLSGCRNNQTSPSIEESQIGFQDSFNVEDIKNNQIWQKVLNFSSAVECDICKDLVATHGFYQHLCGVHREFVGNDETFCSFNEALQLLNGGNETPSAREREDYQQQEHRLMSEINSLNDHLSEKVARIEELEHEKEELTIRVENAEGHVRELSHEVENSSIKTEKIQLELDKALLDLKQTKLNWAMTEEKRGETENQLKTEIKYLIGKLIKAKNKLAENKENEDQSAYLNKLINLVNSNSSSNPGSKVSSDRGLRIKDENEIPVRDFDDHSRDVSSFQDTCNFEQDSPCHKKVNSLKAMKINKTNPLRSATPSGYHTSAGGQRLSGQIRYGSTQRARASTNTINNSSQSFIDRRHISTGRNGRMSSSNSFVANTGYSQYMNAGIYARKNSSPRREHSASFTGVHMKRS
eukprot:CAMPEP_0115040520 /NCGR_PEP_ID=MMETSP0216-20121206/44868_1 /TAXON_ID=223996 /ORGANISM="Protocruzia adherens, Strain Boccale" /LENGTH=960 /DNA_ID=CAMNT_0002421757 /DNA_START=172 /DNA_END=3054 /DNA_ORIENTATION=-